MSPFRRKQTPSMFCLFASCIKYMQMCALSKARDTCHLKKHIELKDLLTESNPMDNKWLIMQFQKLGQETGSKIKRYTFILENKNRKIPLLKVTSVI